jgi:hypothetical protein
MWWKKLSRSDARQETGGSLMPFRFTKENCPGDFTTWFREVFFKELKWNNTTRRDSRFEEADVIISVIIMGRNLGQRLMRLTHAECRHGNHSAPATHLDFDLETKEYLRSNNMTDKYIIFSKDLAGGFQLVIQDNAPQYGGYPGNAAFC